MKRKRIKLAMLSVLLLLGLIVLGYHSNSLRANPVNPECPNGCKPCGQYCYCNGDHPNLAEAVWKPIEIEKK